MIFRVWSFDPAKVEQEGYTLVREFEFEEDALNYAEEEHAESGQFFRVEKNYSSYDQIIFEHSKPEESQQ